jgi:protein-S-isoprenylcysteine O-methyltransferase Ste14
MPGSSRWSEFRALGGPWVVAQFAVMAVVGAAWLVPPAWPEPVRAPLRFAGLALAAIGLALVFWAHASLGRAFTPFPRPPEGAERTERGPYRFARHPLYGGGLLFFGGVSLARSIPALGLTLGLALLWRAKSIAEERFLVGRFPEYEAYRSRTPRRFLPGVY